MKIAILTCHRAYNMGAMLQAWALKRVLEQMGHSVEMPELNAVGSLRYKVFSPRRYAGAVARALVGRFAAAGQLLTEDATYLGYRRFQKDELHSVPCRLDQLGRYDLFVVGSDQVWNPDIMLDSTGLFYGETLPSNKPVIGYALSMGDELPQRDDPERVAKAVRRFAALTARERMIQGYLERLGFPRPEIVLDPTLLLKTGDYAAIEAKRLVHEPYLFVYNIGAGPKAWEIAEDVARRVGLKRIVFESGTLGWSPKHRQGQAWGDLPGKFLSYVRHAAATLVFSFHGTAFSVIYGKPFVSVSYATKEKLNDTRQASLLDAAGMRDRLFHISDAPAQMADTLLSAIRNPTTADLSSLANKSRQTLENMIIHCSPSPSTFASTQTSTSNFNS